MTLVDLGHSTIRLGQSMRNFQKNVCSHYKTKELPSELAAHTRQQSKKKANDGKLAATATRGSRQKHFNLETYKFHSLGDYALSICLHGTSDSYNTQIGKFCFYYFIGNLLIFNTRGNLSIGKNDFTPGFERECIPQGLQRKLYISDWFTWLPRGLPVVPRSNCRKVWLAISPWRKYYHPHHHLLTTIYLLRHATGWTLQITLMWMRETWLLRCVINT